MAIALATALWPPLSGTVVQAQDGSSRNRDNRRRNIEGVALESANNNQFQMRTTSGRVITVIARQADQARKVDRGDRVAVAGYYRGRDSFDAEDLNLLEDNDGDDTVSNERRNIGGYALGSATDNQFQIRTDRGRVITVIARQADQARKVNRGDHVTVAGYFKGRNRFDAEDLNIDSSDGDYQSGQRQTINGVATQAANGNQFEMRTDRDRVITVIARQADQARKVDRGDHVTVAGYFRDRKTFDAEDLNINEYVDDDNMDSRQTVNGTALGSATNNRFEMRTSSGRVLNVTARQSKQAQKVRRGDRVTVAGYYRGRDSFDAEDLNINSY